MEPTEVNPQIEVPQRAKVPQRTEVTELELAALVVRPEARALRPVADAPRLSAASGELLREIQIVDEKGERRSVHVPVERPLTVRVDDRELVTLMTLGAAPEWLVLGYLRNQRLIGEVTVIESITVDWASGTAAVKRQPDARGFETSLARQPAGTACGLGTVFGDVMHEQEIPPRPASARISQRTLLRLLDTMRQHDAIHRAAGSVHSCALFRGEELLLSVEDVSRHNGVDTVTGWMRLHGVLGCDKILFTTGRLTGEMVMKSAHNGIPIVVSRNGVTAMGYDLAVKLGMTLFGRAANRRFLCYTGAEHFDTEPDTD